MAINIARRKFLVALGGTAFAWPLAALAQQPVSLRRIAALMSAGTHDAQGQVGFAAFQQGLEKLGWSAGRNLRIDVRWSENNVSRNRQYASELVALAPDVILASGTLGVTALQNVTRTLPIVFVRVSDPVGAGVVDNLAQPGGNATGFMNFEYSLSGKWLELLKQIAPQVTRAAVVRDPANPAGVGQFAAIQSVAQSLAVELRPIDARDAGEIERSVAAFARSPNGGLIVAPSASEGPHHDLIVMLAARHKLPAVYSERERVTEGGLISYGPDWVDQFRRAAAYVDRVLNGEKPADLPVQAPTKFELAINLKTAKALGLTLPQSLIATADEVIE
jgi:putative tryptophan/tyrosine transport system substrate-binding protein